MHALLLEGFADKFYLRHVWRGGSGVFTRVCLWKKYLRQIIGVFSRTLGNR